MPHLEFGRLGWISDWPYSQYPSNLYNDPMFTEWTLTVYIEPTQINTDTLAQSMFTLDSWQEMFVHSSHFQSIQPAGVSRDHCFNDPA